MGMDNQAGRELAYNPEHHAKTKHIQRRHFFVRELVEDFRVTVPFVRSQDNERILHEAVEVISVLCHARSYHEHAMTIHPYALCVCYTLHCASVYGGVLNEEPLRSRGHTVPRYPQS